MAVPARRLYGGVKRRDIDFLRGALAAGMDPMTGIQMFEGYKSDAAARRQAMLEAQLEAQGSMADPAAGLDELRENIIDWTTGEEPVGYEQLGARVSGLGSLLGLDLGKNPYESVPGLSQFYAGQQVGVDDEDRKAIAQAVDRGIQQGKDRHTIRIEFAEMMRAAMGPLYEGIKDQVNIILDEYYADPIKATMDANAA